MENANDDKNHSAMRAMFPMLATAVMCLAVHGYRFANSMFSHDALIEIVQDDAAWQIALGRYFEPAIIFFRGNLCSPWLLCLLQMVWLALSVYLLTDLFRMQDKFAILVVAGVVVSSETFIILNASFLAWSDMYAFALFAGIFGVWCIEKRKLFYVLMGIASIIISIATYQAYVSVAITLMLILAVLQLCDFSKDMKRIIKLLVYYAAALFLAAAVYYIVWLLIRGVLGIWAADTYNGMASVGHYENGLLLSSVLAAYKNVFLCFLAPAEMSTIVFRGIKLGDIWKYAVIAVNVAMAIVILSGTAYICRKQMDRHRLRGEYSAVRCILIALLMILFPLACNFVCVMSKGMEHPLMMFGSNMLYVFAVIMAERVKPPADARDLTAGRIRLFRGMTAVQIVAILLGVLVWNHFVYANQIYFKKSLQEKAAYSLMSRIVTDVEDMPEYVPGVTPVAISGYFETSPYLTELSGFENLTADFMGKSSLTYQGTDYAMITYYLSIDMNLTRVDASADAIREMPVYPADGSISMVDGVMVVKVSE